MAGDGDLEIRPLAPSRVADVRTVLASTFGSQCWDLFFRFTNDQRRAAGIAGKMTPEHEARRREILAKLARRKRGSAGLVAYADGEPVGFISLGPRSDYPGVERSRAMAAVEGYPRPDGTRVHDGSVAQGTESMFRRAGFRRIRGVQPGLPRYYAPRVTMRAACAPSRKTSSRSRTPSRAAR